jgi:drug/metabolite transporter (DMT)-like permease
VPLDAFLLVLGAAGLHAGWNLLLAGAADTRAATAGALAVVAAVCLPVAALTWDVAAAALPYLAASVALEIAYFVLLAAAYDRGDLGVVYPIARGAAPVLVLVAAAIAGRGDPTSWQVAGVLLVAAGVVAVRGGGATPAASRDVLLALGVGATIAGYTLADDTGLDHAATVPYLCVVVGVPGAVYAAAFAARAGRDALRSIRFAAAAAPRALDRRATRKGGEAPRRTDPRDTGGERAATPRSAALRHAAREGAATPRFAALRHAAREGAATPRFAALRHAAREGAAALRRQVDARAVAIAAGMAGAYGLALAALSLADPAPVAAIREASVVIAAAVAPRVLGESGGKARTLGAAAVFAGVVAVALG